MKHLSLCVLLAAAVGVSPRPAAPEENEYLDFDTSFTNFEGMGTTGDDVGSFDETNLAGIEDEYATPTEAVEKTATLERRFEETTGKSGTSQQRVTSLLTEWIHGLQTEDFAKKEAIQSERAERLSQLDQLAKETTVKVDAARRERLALYKNVDWLRRSLHCQETKHAEDLKLIGQNFVHMQQKIASLANTVSRLSQIQNEESDSSVY